VALPVARTSQTSMVRRSLELVGSVIEPSANSPSTPRPASIGRAVSKANRLRRICPPAARLMIRAQMSIGMPYKSLGLAVGCSPDHDFAT